MNVLRQKVFEFLYVKSNGLDIITCQVGPSKIASLSFCGDQNDAVYVSMISHFVRRLSTHSALYLNGVFVYGKVHVSPQKRGWWERHLRKLEIKYKIK